MPHCNICGAETTNKIACPKHSRLNSVWKSYNNTRSKRGLGPVTIEQYLEHRKYVKDNGHKQRTSVFNPEDLTGPTVVWDGNGHSPCDQGCEHRDKDKSRFGCIKCEERSRYDEWCRREFYGIELLARPDRALRGPRKPVVS